jgi:hypothetical protein
MALTSISTGGIKDAQVTAGKLHADALDRTYTLGADGSNHYTFTGEGLTGAVNDPTLYLTRGKTYRFVNGNSAGAHPFRIQTTVNGSAGTEYNTGVTNNGGAGGSTIVFEVPHDAPDVLYYQCTSHGSMGGIFYITGALADGTVTTAKLADDAVTDAKLANSINSAIAANTAKVQTTINNNADNRVITGSGTANTLEGESNLKYDGTLKLNGLTNTAGQNSDALTVNRTDGLQLFGINWNVDANEVSFSGNTKNYVFKNKSSSAESIRFPSTGGITFNGDTAAANALDDYEEGTWTPSTTEGMNTIYGAHYIKVGAKVSIQAYIALPTSSSSDNIRIDSFPFTAKGSNHFAIGASYSQWSGSDHIFIQMSANTSQAHIYKNSGNAVTFADGSGGYFLFSMTYFIA